VPVLTSLEPLRVVEGGRLWLHGDLGELLDAYFPEVAEEVPHG